jgi:hypothetical protein
MIKIYNEYKLLNNKHFHKLYGRFVFASGRAVITHERNRNILQVGNHFIKEFF